jgi:GAF domain-containing protein
MVEFIKRIFAPPVLEGDEKTRMAVLLNSILWAVILIGAIYTTVAPFLLGQYFSAALTAIVVATALASRALMHRGYMRAATILLLVILHATLVAAIAISGGTFGASYFSLIMTTVIAGVLLGGRSAYIMAGINSVTGLGVMLIQDVLPEPLIPQLPVTLWSSLVVYVFFTAALLSASRKGVDKLLDNLKTIQVELIQKNRELQEIGENLERSVSERTAELNAANQRNEKRAGQFQAIVQVSRAISQTQNLERLLPDITDLISRQFGYYHVGIFLIDEINEFASLAATNSEGGKKMLARSHKLRIGQTGIVGNVAGTGAPRIAMETGVDALYFNNPELPETRAEAALPLFGQGQRVIGVLDVQSKDANAFGQEDIQTLTALADQVAIAINNARLFEETQKSLKEADAVYRQDLKAGWARYARAQKLAGIRRHSLKTNFLAEPIDVPGASEALRSGGIIIHKEGGNGAANLAIPMKLRGETVGVLNIRSEDKNEWSDDEMDIINAIIERAALSIENARLLEESRKTAERERAIGEISAKIGSGTEIESILRTAVRELGTQIGGAQVTIEIGGGDK